MKKNVVETTNMIGPKMYINHHWINHEGQINTMGKWIQVLSMQLSTTWSMQLHATQMIIGKQDSQL